jgi:hypothetical protein
VCCSNWWTPACSSPAASKAIRKVAATSAAVMVVMTAADRLIKLIGDPYSTEH